MIGTAPAAEGRTPTIEQAAEVLQCDTDTAAVRFNSGELPGVKFGRRWVIPAPAFCRRLNELALEEAEHRRTEFAKQRPTRQPQPPAHAFYFCGVTGQASRCFRTSSAWPSACPANS